MTWQAFERPNDVEDEDEDFDAEGLVAAAESGELDLTEMFEGVDLNPESWKDVISDDPGS